MNYRNWLKTAISRIKHSDSPRRDAEILLAFVTGRTRTFILAFDETRLTPKQQWELEALVLRREAGEPVAYIVGKREFWSLPLSVSPATLIPRPDTECLVAMALDLLPTTPCKILDLGTGTGAIALAIASERRSCSVTAVDIRPDALELAKHNAKNLNINNIRFLQGDWFNTLSPENFTLIVSNPPYIDAADLYLIQGDVRFEPTSALIAAEQGLADLDAIACKAAPYLKPGGWLLLEHGWNQGGSVRSLLLNYGFIAVSTFRDYGNNERITLGRFYQN